jgi:Cys-tRNA(Pro)/Cys-tRNA(Cys) deacylase
MTVAGGAERLVITIGSFDGDDHGTAALSYAALVAGKGTPATAQLTKAKIAHTLHSYEHGSEAAYGPEAAEVLGLDPGVVFKTLVAEVDGTLTVGVVPVSAKLDLKALAAAVGGKRAKMADVAAAERATGYVAGGISPLGQKKRLRTVIDASAEKLPTMYCSAGRRGLEVQLSPADLAQLTGATFAQIATVQ